MRSYSHLLLTAAIQKKGWLPGRAVLLGSVLPDVPLGLLTLAYWLDRRWLRPHLPDKTRCSPTYNHLFFHNPFWIAAHNFFHAPLILLLLAWFGRRRPLLGLAVGCGLHSAIDFATHVQDGPLPAFPLNWHYRLPGPISYWDEQHGGRAFGWFELMLDLVLALYLWRGGK